MVIQSNMSPEAIIEVWKETEDILKKHNVPITKQTLKSLMESEILSSLLLELNSVVGSSTATCIEGG